MWREPDGGDLPDDGRGLGKDFVVEVEDGVLLLDSEEAGRNGQEFQKDRDGRGVGVEEAGRDGGAAPGGLFVALDFSVGAGRRELLVAFPDLHPAIRTASAQLGTLHRVGPDGGRIHPDLEGKEENGANYYSAERERSISDAPIGFGRAKW